MQSKPLYDYFLFVIGGGSGGMACSKKAASYGLKVGLADFVKPSSQGTTWGLGGTCVNVGCIPKKLMHYAGQLGELRKDQVECGWDVQTDREHNWSQMIQNVNSHVKSLNWGSKKELAKSEVEYHNCLAKILAPHQIELMDKQGKTKIVTAQNILLAMGGRPFLPDIPGVKEYAITSDDIFWRQTAPGRTLVFGSGYIGTECSGFIKGLGYPTELLFRNKILSEFDQDMALRVRRSLEEIGVKTAKGNILQITKIGKELHVELNLQDEESGEFQIVTKVYDTVLFATGRRPDLNPEIFKLGVELSKSGKIIVDNKFQTRASGIYAIGDIIEGGKELTPVAIKQGRYLAEGLFTNNWKSIDYSAVATTIFSPVEYSCCGKSEIEAIQQIGEENVEVYHSNFKPLEWNFLSDKPSDLCYTKVIVDLRDNTVIGIHYFGPNAGEVMQGFAIAISMKMKYSALSEIVGIHPTCAEEIVSLSLTKRENPDPSREGC